jgi:hypothetical protein
MLAGHLWKYPLFRGSLVDYSQQPIEVDDEYVMSQSVLDGRTNQTLFLIHLTR